MSDIENIHISKRDAGPSRYLYDLIKKKLNLSDFLETEVGCDLTWVRDNTQAKMICPMPDHKDSQPSFHITLYEDSNVWVFHCFGCGKKGTIIDFCENYYDLKNSYEAVVWICKKFGFKESKDLVIEGLKDVKKKINIQNKIEYENMVVSNSGRILLRKNFDGYSQFVAKCYRDLNIAINSENLDGVKEVGKMMSEKLMEGD